MKPCKIWILLFAIPLLFSCRFDSKTRYEAKKSSFDDDTIISIEVPASDKKFPVNDSSAIALIKGVPEIKQIIDYNYEDSTIFNELQIESIPGDSDDNWQFTIVQFHTRTEHATNLLWLLVNANTGKISVWDIPKDTIVPIDSWLKTRIKK
jgi:hypothetical protein